MIYKFSKFIIFVCSVLFAYAETLTEYLNEAKILSSQGKYGDALSAYNKAIELDPNNYVVYIKRAFILMNLNKNSEAVDDFSKVISLKPDFNQVNILYYTS